MDIPSTQNWKAKKTMSRKGFNMGAVDQAHSTLRTFSLGVVQATAIVRENLICLAYFHSLCGGPVEGNQAFAAKRYAGIGVTQSFDLYLSLTIDINGLDLSKLLLWFVNRGIVSPERE